jgi:hypothetical protein
MDGNEAAQRRLLLVKSPTVTSGYADYHGDQVYSIRELGVVVASGQTRIFYPWNRVVSFTYHNDDIAARKVIQGF